MEIIKPNVILEVSTPDAEKVIEKAARTCYKSEEKITADSHINFIKNIMKSGHSSVLEHASATFRIITSRDILQEIARHRIGSYSVESTRYVNYAKKNGLQFIQPSWVNDEDIYNMYTHPLASTALHKWYRQLESIENTYMSLINEGWKPQQARSVLPGCLKTEIVMTMNFRSWLNFLELRTSKAAHPDIRIIADMIGKELYKIAPTVFEEYK